MKKKKAILTKQKHNRSHKNAWCSYCITNTMNLLPKSECDLSSLGFESVSIGNYQIWQAANIPENYECA